MKDYSCSLSSLVLEEPTDLGGAVSTWDTSRALLHEATRGLVADWLTGSSDWGDDQVFSSGSRGAAEEVKLQQPGSKTDF